MNKIPSFLLAVLALLLGAAVAIQTVRLKHQKAQATAAASALEKEAGQVEQLKADVRRLEDIRRTSRREVNDLRHELADVRSAPLTVEPASVSGASATADGLTATNPKGGAMGGMLAKMLEDPDMKQFIRNQQRQMMDPLYEPLIRRLGLTAAEGQVFKDYLADTQRSAANQAGALFGGSATDRTEAMATISAEQKRADETLKVFLGEEGYAQYKDYQETLGERMQLNQFRLQSGDQYRMTDDQTEWLLGLMKEEKRALAASTGQSFPGAGQDPANMQAMFSGENADQVMRMQEAVNQRVYERAAAGLTPDQLESFGRFQTNQLQMMRMGMRMAQQMFGAETKTGPSSQ